MSRQPVTTESRDSRASHRRDHLWAAALAGAMVVTYVVIAAAHGALGAARNDDWAYYRSAFEFARDGTLRPDPYSLAMLVGQVIIAEPVVTLFGPGMASLQVLVCLLGGVGLLASYSVVRAFVPHGWALFSVGCLALGPIYGSISVSFMTDVPSFAFQALCLLAGLRAQQQEGVSAGWLATSLSLGLVAFTIRDYGAAAPLAVLALSLLRTRGSGSVTRHGLVAVAVGFLLALIGLDLWRRGLVDSPSSPTLVRPDRHTMTVVARAFFTTALLVSPATTALVPRRLPTMRGRAAVLPALAVVVVSGAAAVITRHNPLLIGNYVTPVGSYPETLGNGEAVVPHAGWVALQVVAVVSAALVCIVALDSLRTLRRPRPVAPREPLSSTAALLAGLYVGASLGLIAAVHLLTSGPLFDRYLLSVVPFLAALVVLACRPRTGAQASGRMAAGALGLLAVLGLAFVDASATFDGARWDLSRTVADKGYSASTIDGGLEWFGFHQPGAIQAPHATPAGAPFYWGLFAQPDVCVVVSLPDADGRYRGQGDGTRVAGLTAHTLFGLRYPLRAYPTPATCRHGR